MFLSQASPLHGTGCWSCRDRRDHVGARGQAIAADGTPSSVIKNIVDRPKNHRYWQGFLSAPRLAEVDKMALGCRVVQLVAPRFAEGITDQLAIGQVSALYARHMGLK